MHEKGRMAETITPFRLSDMQPNRIMQLIGRTGSGKTVLLFSIMKYMRDKVDYWVLFTPTKDTEDDWRYVAPPECIFSKFQERYLRDLLAIQDSLARRQRRRRTVCMIWDDMMFEKNISNNDAVREVFFNGRHLDMYFINISQWQMDLRPHERLNSSYIFLFAQDEEDQRERIRKYFVGRLRPREFSAAFSECTKHKRCMVADKVRHTLHWFLADPADSEGATEEAPPEDTATRPRCAICADEEGPWRYVMKELSRSGQPHPNRDAHRRRGCFGWRVGCDALWKLHKRFGKDSELDPRHDAVLQLAAPAAPPPPKGAVKPPPKEKTVVVLDDPDSDTSDGSN